MCWPLIVVAWVRSQDTPCKGFGVYPGTSVFIIPSMLSIHSSTTDAIKNLAVDSVVE